MKWTHYPTEKDRKNSDGGVSVTGQLWSDGPTPGTKWVIPNGVRAAVLVVTRASSNGGKPYSVGILSQVKALPGETDPG